VKYKLAFVFRSLACGRIENTERNREVLWRPMRDHLEASDIFELCNRVPSGPTLFSNLLVASQMRWNGKWMVCGVCHGLTSILKLRLDLGLDLTLGSKRVIECLYSELDPGREKLSNYATI
jgi:hypothetical protein